MEKHQDFIFQIDYRDRPKLWSHLHPSAKPYILKTMYDNGNILHKTVYLHLQYAKTVADLRRLLPFALNVKTDVPKFKTMKAALRIRYNNDTILVKMAHDINMQLGTLDKPETQN